VEVKWEEFVVQPVYWIMDPDLEKFCAEFKNDRVPLESLRSYFGYYKTNELKLEDLIYEFMVAVDFYTPEELLSTLDLDPRMKLKQWVEESPEEDNIILSSARTLVIHADSIRKMKAYFKEHLEG
jgi:hypothetical protein